MTPHPEFSGSGLRDSSSDLVWTQRSDLLHEPAWCLIKSGSRSWFALLALTGNQGNRDWLSALGTLAASIAVHLMNSDSETPRDRAVWASTSRSCGRRRTATRAVRRRDSDRRRCGASRRALASLLAASISAAAGLFMVRIRSCRTARRYNRDGVSRRLYRLVMRRSG